MSPESLIFLPVVEIFLLYFKDVLIFFRPIVFLYEDMSNFNPFLENAISIITFVCNITIDKIALTAIPELVTN